MKLLPVLICGAAAACVMSAPLAANDWLSRTKAGETHVIVHSYETSTTSGDGLGSSSSSGHDGLLETVVSVSEGEALIEYDLPRGVSEEDRTRQWELPARLKIADDGTVALVNRDELENRLDKWLEAAKWNRDLCGKWYFTWNAFKVECDPETAKEIVPTFGLRFIDAHDGAPVDDPLALKPGTMARDGEDFIARMEVDPGVVQRQRAKSDAIVAQITGKQLNEAAALVERQKEKVSGEIVVRFSVDPSGAVIRRERILNLQTINAVGKIEVETRKQTTEVVEDEG